MHTMSHSRHLGDQARIHTRYGLFPPLSADSSTPFWRVLHSACVNSSSCSILTKVDTPGILLLYWNTIGEVRASPALLSVVTSSELSIANVDSVRGGQN